MTLPRERATSTQSSVTCVKVQSLPSTGMPFIPDQKLSGLKNAQNGGFGEKYTVSPTFEFSSDGLVQMPPRARRRDRQLLSRKGHSYGSCR